MNNVGLRRQFKAGKPIAFTELGVPIFARNENGVPICNALRRNHQPLRCQSIFLKENGRCMMHGGNNRTGVMHGMSNGANRYRGLKSDLRKTYVDFMENNPDYLSLKAEMGFTVARLEQLADRLRDNPDTATLRHFRALVTRGKRAKAIDEITAQCKELRACITELERLVAAGIKDRELHKEIQQTQRHLRTLAETEVKRLSAAQRQISERDFMIIIGKLFALIRDRVTDPVTIKAISSGVEDIMGEYKAWTSSADETNT